MSLHDIRYKIDSIDSQITALLKERSLLIKEVKSIKQNSLYKIAFAREIDMAYKLSTSDFGLYNNTYMQKIWRDLISATLHIECGLHVSVYKSHQLHALWEITKDHFLTPNLTLDDDITNIFNNIINKKIDCAVLPYDDFQSKWWLMLLQDNYKPIKINLILPFIKGIKILNPIKGVCVSLNNQDISHDNFFYIITTATLLSSDASITILDKENHNYFIISKYDTTSLSNKLKIAMSCMTFVGSSSNAIE